MELTFEGQQVNGGERLQVEMKHGDIVTIGFVGLDGLYQVINVVVQNQVGVVTHESSGEHMVIRK